MVINKSIEFTIKLICAVAAIVYIVYRLLHLPDLGETLSVFFENIGRGNISTIAIVIGLMPLNWGLEVQKWRFLMAHNYPVPLGKAIRAILSGLSLALLTPNRVGEMATRVLVLPKEHRIKGIWLGSLSGLAQTVVTLLFGLLGGSILLITNADVDIALLSNNYLIFAIGVSGGVIVLFSYFYLYRIVRWISSWKWLPFAKGNFKVLRDVSPRDKLILLGLSAVKYCVYLNQFFLIIVVCDIPITWLQGLITISVIYLVLTFIPVAALADAGIRGSVALMVIGLYADLPVNILAASLFVWIINIAIPSLIGLILLNKIKF